MNVIGTLILAVALGMVFFAQRRRAVIGIMVGVLFLTQGQHVEVFGFNIFAIRFVELAAFIRVVLRREFTFSNLTRIDKLFLMLFAYTTVVFMLRSNVDQANTIGYAVDAYLCYFAFRGLVGGVEDFHWILRDFLFLLVPYTALILYESFTKHNPFDSMGDVLYGNWTRDGRVRCQGSFRNAALLGSIFASFLPLYLGFWVTKIDRKLAILGSTLCLLIVWASNSGGPASAAALAMLGWVFWLMRTKMKLIRRSMVAVFIALVLVMNAPVWYVLARISSITGGNGWHRAHLLDMAFQHISLWWLSGMPITETADWFPYVLSITGGADITNQYIGFGIQAGLGSMLLFCVLLMQAYKKIGRSLTTVRSYDGGLDLREPMLWGLGVMLTVHCTNWLDITYFDQSYVIWYFHLAVINNVTESCLSADSATEVENTLLGSTSQAT
jgi:hypothetical protein